MADVISLTLSQATALPTAYSVASAAIPTIGNVCATPGHSLDPYPEEWKMASPGTDATVEEEGTSIKARNVKKHLS